MELDTDFSNNPSLCHSRTIIHLDIDCFYAQVEILRNPSLKGKPVGIRQKGCLVTCNYEARVFGIKKCSNVKDALNLCPQLILVNGEDLTPYRKMSQEINSLLKEFSPQVEKLGFDENFIDITDLIKEREVNDGDKFIGHIFGQNSDSEELKPCNCGCHQNLLIGSHIAQEIRSTLYKRLKITSCAGVAHNKLLSKLVSGKNKPNQQTILYPEHTKMLLSTLESVRDLPGVGPATAKKLASSNVNSIKDLQEYPIEQLIKDLGKDVAFKLKELAYGVQNCPVLATGKTQSHGIEDSFQPCSDYKECKSKIEKMILKLLERLLDDERMPQTAKLTILRVTDGVTSSTRESRQCSLPSEIFNGFSSSNLDLVQIRILPLLEQLFKKLIDVEKPFSLRLISVTFLKLEEPNTGQKKIDSYFKSKREAEEESESQKQSPRSAETKKRRSATNTLTNFCQLPPNVDPLVFKELPSDVKKELIQEWYDHRTSNL